MMNFIIIAWSSAYGWQWTASPLATGQPTTGVSIAAVMGAITPDNVQWIGQLFLGLAGSDLTGRNLH